MVSIGILADCFCLEERCMSTYFHNVQIQKKGIIMIPLVFVCGKGGIRTPGTSRYGGFQDRCNRPLYHLSKGCFQEIFANR